MAVLTIAGLTLREAVRKRTLFGALLMGLLIFGLSLLLIPIRHELESRVADFSHDQRWLLQQAPIARSHIMSLCFFTIRALGSLFAVLLAGGALSGEIERGLFAVILPKPIHRWEIYVGKWLGLQAILVGSVLFWTALVWLSLTVQTHAQLTSILLAGCYLALFPVVLGTMTLTLSAVTPRLLGTVVALVLGAFSWFDGILNTLGMYWDTELLQKIANVASVIVPQGCIAWWIRNATQGITFYDERIPPLGESPQMVREWGESHLHHFAHLDAVYLVGYLLTLFIVGIFLFQRRDI